TSAVLIIDGQPVTAEVTGGQRRTQLRYASPKPLRGVVSVGVQIQDLATNAIDREVARFIIAGTTFIEGDIDQDGRVDGVDLVLLARAFGTTVGETRYDSDADLNDDGVIDGKDLAVLATTFGESL
ncbi:MAG: hypothetical protein K8J08_14895, partial [Thermoanaerobaculia bacterium]|nr:hypothetical protein [Thermoanaerobaculia bacterium]